MKYLTRDCDCPPVVTGVGGKRPEKCACGYRYFTEKEIQHPNRSQPSYGSLALRQCARCGEEFKPSRSFQKYCGAECGRLGIRLTRQCPSCGETFERDLRQGPRTYCSPKCANEATSAERGRRLRKPAIPCVQCGKDFHPKNLEQRFCSQVCNGKGHLRKRPRGTHAPHNWGLKKKGESACRKCGRNAEHLHHIVPRSQSREGAGNFDNGLPLCFNCHRGWHDRRVTIPITCLRVPEILTAIELTDEIWVERNYPIPSTQEEVELVESIGSLGMAYEALPHYLGEHREAFLELTLERRPQGETLKLFAQAIEDAGSIGLALLRISPGAAA